MQEYHKSFKISCGFHTVFTDGLKKRSSLCLYQGDWYHSSPLTVKQSVSEIKGALGARRAHFRGRAHVFRTCAPDVRRFFHSILIAIY